MKKYKVTAYFVQYSYGTTIIEAESPADAADLADELTSSDFENMTPNDGDLEIDDIEEIKEENE